MSLTIAASAFGSATARMIRDHFPINDVYLCAVAAFSAARELINDQDPDTDRALSQFFDDGNPNVDTYGVSA